jgi:hypothetical protein
MTRQYSGGGVDLGNKRIQVAPNLAQPTVVAPPPPDRSLAFMERQAIQNATMARVYDGIADRKARKHHAAQEQERQEYLGDYYEPRPYI